MTAVMPSKDFSVENKLPLVVQGLLSLTEEMFYLKMRRDSYLWLRGLSYE